MEFKFCPKCETDRPISDFSKNRNRKDGLQYQCKACFANWFTSLSDEELEAKRVREHGYYSRMSPERKERVLEADRLRYQTPKRKAQVRESQKRYYNNHSEKWVGYVNARRARLANAEGQHTDGEWNDLVTYYQSKCAYCGNECVLTKDHAVPLSRGGSDFIENIVPACSKCNNRKGTLTATEFCHGVQ